VSYYYYAPEPFHVGLFSAAFRREAAKAAPDIVPILDITFPDAARRYSSVGAQSETLGQYRPLIEEWGTLRPQADSRGNRLSAPSLEVVIIDTPDSGRALTKLLGGSNRNTVRGSAAKARWASLNVSEPDWFTLCDWVLDRWVQEGMNWRLTLQPDESFLDRKFPKQAINTAIWPKAHTDALGQYAPILYGRHDSLGADSEEAPAGFVPTYYVDTSAFVYTPSIAWMKAVDKVYADGTEVTSGFSITHPVQGGIQWTAIDFVSDQGDAVITCDVQGIEDEGDGTGTLITNPARQLEHLITNFILGDYRSGLWPVSSTRLDPTLFAEAADFLDAMGQDGSKQFGGDQEKGIDAFNGWAVSEGLKPFWTLGGQLAVRPLDHRYERIYGDHPWWKEEHEEGASFAIESDPENVTSRYSVEFVYDNAQGKFQRQLDVSDLSVETGEPIVESIERAWSESKA
jgi:hypothetical protein